MANYPPRGLEGVFLFEVNGFPVSVGRIAGCPHVFTSWGHGEPQEFRGARRPWPQPHWKLVDEAAFRELITIKLAGY